MLASVIDGRVDQYVLDGKELNVKIPTVLLERMERLSLQVRKREKFIHCSFEKKYFFCLDVVFF